MVVDLWKKEKVKNIGNDEKKVIVILLELMERLTLERSEYAINALDSWKYGVVNGFVKSMQIVVAEEYIVESGVDENFWEEAMWQIWGDMVIGSCCWWTMLMMLVKV